MTARRAQSALARQSPSPAGVGHPPFPANRLRLAPARVAARRGRVGYRALRLANGLARWGTLTADSYASGPRNTPLRGSSALSPGAARGLDRPASSRRHRGCRAGLCVGRQRQDRPRPRLGRSVRPRRPLAWVSVERDEHDAQRFWLTLVTALANAGGVVGRVDPAPSFRGAAVIQKLLADLESLEEPVALVIDDLHELRSPDALHWLEVLLRAMPDQLQVFLLTREYPALGLHRLRLAGRLTELGTQTCASPCMRPETYSAPWISHSPTRASTCFTSARRAGRRACVSRRSRWRITPTPSASSESSPEPSAPSRST